MACRFHPREPAAEHDNRQQPFSLGIVGFSNCLLKTCDNLVAEGEAVAHCPERVSVGRHTWNFIEVGA